MHRFLLIGVVALPLAALLTGCTSADGERRPLVLATTTSVDGSGLLDAIVPAFERAHAEYALKVVAVGTGEALKLGERRDADVLLTHDSAAEERFVALGHASSRHAVMHNDFVIIGPAADPARIRGLPPVAALRRIEELGGVFVSRADDSGTHRHELRLRARAHLPEPRPGPRYVEAGQGMLETLLIADERDAYTLTDRGTFLANGGDVALVVLVDGGEDLRNPYGVMTVTGARNEAGARAFADWITSREGQAVIRAFGRERFGRPLFIPASGP